jgi:hypothetical protein
MRRYLVEQFDQRLEQEFRRKFGQYFRWIKVFFNVMQRDVERWAEGVSSFSIMKNTLEENLFDSVHYGVKVRDYRPGDLVTYDELVEKLIPGICDGFMSYLEGAIEELIEDFYAEDASARYYLKRLTIGVIEVEITSIFYQKFGKPYYTINGDIFRFTLYYGFQLKYWMDFWVRRKRGDLNLDFLV